MIRVETKYIGSIMRVIPLSRAVIKDRMVRTARLLCEEAKRLVPVRTGRLQRSLQWEVLEKGPLIEGWYGSNRPWRGEKSVPYAVFIELGFYHVRARRFVGPFPYLRGAIWSKAGEVRRIWRGRPVIFEPRLRVER